MNAYFHLCDCTCSNVMCVCSTICGSNKKYLCSFYLFLEVICIAHVFQSFSSFFVWKTYFLGVFVTYFMCKLSREFNWSNSQVFQLWIGSFSCKVELAKNKLIFFAKSTLLYSTLPPSPSIQTNHNSFHWFWSLDYVFRGFMFIVKIFSNKDWKT